MRCPGVEVDEVAVLVGDRLRAQLADLAGTRGIWRGRDCADALQDGERDRSPPRRTSGGARVVPRLDAQATPGRQAASPAVSAPRPRSGSISGAASTIGRLDGAAASVIDDDGQPSQLPSSRSCTAPSSSSMPSSSTSPPCAARKGRTEASAPSTRSSSDSGWRPCTSSRLATSSSSAKSSISAGRPCSAPAPTVRASPAP